MRRLLRRFNPKEGGQALPLFALMIFVLLGFVAMSIDVGRYVWARTSIQAGVDASALAAAQSLPDWSDAQTTGAAYWVDNSGFIQSQGTNVQFSIQPQAGNKALTVEASADIPTWFAKFFGVPEWHVSADGDAESIVIDAMLVLDRSGSMCWDSHGPNGNYTGQVKLASSVNSTATTFSWTKNNPTQPGNMAPKPLTSYFYVGQVFKLDSEWIRVDSINNGANTTTVTRHRNSSTAASHNSGRRPTGDTCQAAGPGPYYPWEYVKTGAEVFVDTFNPAYDKIGYVQFSTKGHEEFGLSSSLAALNTAITNSPDPTASGSSDALTNIAHGTYMGIRELLDNGRTNAKWVIVLLSDGVANRYCSPDETTTCSSVQTNTANAKTHAKAMADLASTHGITIYTIGYGNDSDDDLMQYMADATGGKFFKAPSEADLNDAFLAISKLTQIRLSR